MWSIYSGTDLGVPTPRWRLRLAALRKSKYCWCGPRDDLDGDVLDHFLSFFQDKVMMGACKFCGIDEKQKVDDTRRKMARSRGFEFHDRLQLLQLLSPAAAKNFQQYVSMHTGSLSELDYQVVVDLSQNPDVRRAKGKWPAPTL